MKKKQSMVGNYAGLMAGMAIGGAAMEMADKTMPSGFKEVTQIGIATGIASQAMKKKGKFL